MKALIGEDGDLAQQSQRRNKGLKGQVSVQTRSDEGTLCRVS